ncbi:methyltransferase domain-containing protein [Colletotrichum paranaense]|uniref:Methyltransferase domain-containing protein n=1 Tax=Colletotrichum paranaense TaxID=1914294 RepID=A0ABQ9S945_9PEZI|nr:methyltransferase domain-containing protein [Colletotrichum paranaense]KAK1529805.1 methyltransferase domain-containing protein [Colletotrichum paranaense]
MSNPSPHASASPRNESQDSPAAPTATEPDAAATEPAAIDVDDGASENASTIDDQMYASLTTAFQGLGSWGRGANRRRSSYTASLTSSVVDYPTEYGRRYHAFRAGAYNFPNDEDEMDRLDLVHTLMVKTIGNKLFLAPINKSTLHRVLDVGTGTGIWSIEMGDLFPEAEIIGNDLSAIQPKWVPPNVKFEIDDVESEWVGQNKYDFIFSRYLSGSLADWPTYVNRVSQNLNPGGWAEFQDWSFMLQSDDGTLKDTAIQRWADTFMDACKVFGRDAQIGPKLKDLVQDNTDLINVHHVPFKIPNGPWPKDAHLRDLGMCNLIQLLEGLEGFSLKLLCGGLAWTKEEVLVLCSQVRGELKSGKVHAWYHYDVVYGQKPEKEE